MECGAAAFGVILLAAVGALLGLVAIGVSVYRTRWARAFAVFALAAALSAPALGIVGTFLGRHKVDGALSSGAVDPSIAESLRNEGYSEAAQCTNLGLGFGAAPVLLSLGGLVLAVVRRRA
jgi:hypothetical protein